MTVLVVAIMVAWRNIEADVVILMTIDDDIDVCDDDWLISAWRMTVNDTADKWWWPMIIDLTIISDDDEAVTSQAMALVIMILMALYLNINVYAGGSNDNGAL